MASRILDDHDVAELAELLTLVRDEDAAPLPSAFLERLKAVIGCECLSFGEKDSRRGIHMFLQADDWDGGQYYQAGPFHDDEEELFWQYYWGCEPCSYPDRAGDYTSVIQISDFYSARQWHSTPMYTDLMAPIEHEMVMSAYDGPGRSLRLVCIREAGPAFGERERFLLALLRPHIAEAYRAGLRRRAGSPPLTARQAELLELVRDGHTNRQIARQLKLSEGTVRTHLNNIFVRLDVTSRTAAVTRGLEHVT